MAIDTSHTYNSGLLTLLFVGFCALVIVAQLVPALLMLFGLTKNVTRASGGCRRLAASNELKINKKVFNDSCAESFFLP